MNRNSTLLIIAFVFVTGLFSFGPFSRPLSVQAETPYGEIQLFTEVLSLFVIIMSKKSI